MVSAKQSLDEEGEREAVPADRNLSIDEITQRYYGEWVFMRETELDDDHWPSRGIVIVHAPTHAEMNEALSIAIAHGAVSPDEQYFSFCAYPFVRSGPEMETAAAEFAIGLISAAAQKGRGKPASR